MPSPPLRSYPARHVAGRLSAQWGASAPVTVTEPVTVVGWPGLNVAVRARLNELTVPVAAGSRIGVLEIRQGSHVTSVTLESTSQLSGPSASWRLFR